MAECFTYDSDVYFDELDALGVRHHTRYLLHLERAQQKFFEYLLGVADFDADRDEDIYVVVHSLGPASVRHCASQARSLWSIGSIVFEAGV